MKIDFMTGRAVVLAALILTLLPMTTHARNEDLSDAMESRGGVMYPVTGDSTQEIFRTPPNITDYLRPGMFLGVLPEDCTPVSNGEIGDFYICNHDLALKPTLHGGRVAYEVIKAD